VKYAFIKTKRRQHALTRLCTLLNVSLSGYYDWLDRPVCKAKRSNASLLSKIRCFYQSSCQTYGSPRIHQDLIAAGEQVSINRVARLMKAAGIQPKMAKRFVITTNSKNTLAPAPDRLKRTFSTSKPNCQIQPLFVHDRGGCTSQRYWTYILDK